MLTVPISLLTCYLLQIFYFFLFFLSLPPLSSGWEIRLERMHVVRCIRQHTHTHTHRHGSSHAPARNRKRSHRETVGLTTESEPPSQFPLCCWSGQKERQETQKKKRRGDRLFDLYLNPAERDKAEFSIGPLPFSPGGKEEKKNKRYLYDSSCWK